MKPILYESAHFYVTSTDKAFEVYECGITAAKCVSTIGKSLGLARAIAECSRREDLLAADISRHGIHCPAAVGGSCECVPLFKPRTFTLRNGEVLTEIPSTDGNK